MGLASVLVQVSLCGTGHAELGALEFPFPSEQETSLARLG